MSSWICLNRLSANPASYRVRALEGLLNPHENERWNEYWKSRLLIYATTRLTSRILTASFGSWNRARANQRELAAHLPQHFIWGQ
nr:MAG TPA: hypothetical protein [Caudoviricetes sp.]